VTPRSTAPQRLWADGGQIVNLVIAHPTPACILSRKTKRRQAQDWFSMIEMPPRF